MTQEIVSAERRYLASLGHELKPVAHVGHEGVTSSVVESTEIALESRELIKVRINPNFEGDRHETAQTLSERTSSNLVQVVGKTFLLFKRNEKKPKIVFPADVALKARRRRRKDKEEKANQGLSTDMDIQDGQEKEKSC